jgi:hypothetical protein
MPFALTFEESLILLGVTAALTGVLAPIIVGITNSSRLNEQKQYEEGLKRETAFFEAQTKFLQDFTAAVWDYLEKGLCVSYAAKLGLERFKELWDAYDKESFALLGRIGSQASMARTLFSAKTADRLSDFYHEWLEKKFDHELSGLARNPETTQADWAIWHDKMHRKAQKKAAELISAVAEEAELTYDQQLRRLQPRPGYLRRTLSRLMRLVRRPPVASQEHSRPQDPPGMKPS